MKFLSIPVVLHIVRDITMKDRGGHVIIQKKAVDTTSAQKQLRTFIWIKRALATLKKY